MLRPLDSITRRTKASWLSLSCSAPLEIPAKSLYRRRLLDGLVNKVTLMHVVCTSDTHNTQPTPPQGDTPIHAGDLTQRGTPKELQKSLHWLNHQPRKFIVVVAGNHDLLLDRSYRDKPEDTEQRLRLDRARISYLQDWCHVETRK